MAWVMFCAGFGMLALGVCAGIIGVWLCIVKEFMKGGR